MAGARAVKRTPAALLRRAIGETERANAWRAGGFCARRRALRQLLAQRVPVAARISLRYLAMRAFRAGAPDRAADFSRGHDAPEPGVSSTGSISAWPARAAADLPAARAAFAGSATVTRATHRGAVHRQVLEACGDRTGAAMAAWRAIIDAQAKEALAQQRHTSPRCARAWCAMDFVDIERPRLLQQVLAPLVEDASSDEEMRRIRAALRVYLRQDAAGLSRPRQKPGFLYGAGAADRLLPALDLFPWIRGSWRRAGGHPRQMLAAVAAREGLQPFHDREQLNQLVAGASAEGSWDALFFYRHGERFDANCARCPSPATLERLPRVQFATTAEIPVLAAAPSCIAATNARVVAHAARLRAHVLGERRAWREGKVVFDDTFEHGRGTAAASCA
jgi:aspartate beta-hydroxylase